MCGVEGSYLSGLLYVLIVCIAVVCACVVQCADNGVVFNGMEPVTLPVALMDSVQLVLHSHTQDNTGTRRSHGRKTWLYEVIQDA